MSDWIGRRIGNYEITGLLGEGGMAIVYRARQLNIKREVAIKVMDERLARQSDFARRFEREAETIADLNHAHILKLFDYGQQDDQVYLVMELLRGGSLSSLIRQESLPPERAGQILDQVGSALDYAHRRGIIHRDLKPPNVLFDDAGNAFLTDFGIAKILSETTALTQTGTAMGTPAYMAPEQWQRGGVDSRADLYALGIMLFEMLTGHVLFEADTPYQMMFAHVQEPPPPIRSLRPDLPPAVEAVIQKALAKDPEQRFKSAGEMAAAFKAVLAGHVPAGLGASSAPEDQVTGPQFGVPPAPSVASAQSRSNRTGLLALGAVGLVAVLGWLAVLLSSAGSNQAPTPSRPVATDTQSVIVILPTWTPTAGPKTATPQLTPTTARSDEELALATVHAIATLTATSFTRTPTNTATPTVNQPGTLAALQTQIVGRTQAAAATATALAVASFTKTPTRMPSSTPMPTPTATWTPNNTSVPPTTAPATAAPPPPQETASTQVPKVLTLVAGTGDISSLDSQLATDTSSYQIVVTTHPPLVASLETDLGKINPAIADQWMVSKDLLTYTFTIRKDISWVMWDGKAVAQVKDSAGKPVMVTANDFEYSIKRLLNPATASDYAYLYADATFIKGGADGKPKPLTDLEGAGALKKLENAVAVKAKDAQTLEVTINKPLGYALGIFAMWLNGATPKSQIEKFGDKWTEPGNAYSYGPYVVSEWKHEKSLTMVKNPFWPAGVANSPQAKIDKVTFLMLDETAAFNNYEAGTMDAVSVPLTEIDRVKADPKLSKELVIAPNFCTYVYPFNTTKPPFDDVRMRRAFSYAVDREALVKNVTKGGQEPARWFSRPGLAAAPTVKDSPTLGIGFDKAAAQKELKAYLDEKKITVDKLPPISLVMNQLEGHVKIAEAIQNMWKTNLGITGSKPRSGQSS